MSENSSTIRRNSPGSAGSRGTVRSLEIGRDNQGALKVIEAGGSIE